MVDYSMEVVQSASYVHHIFWYILDTFRIRTSHYTCRVPHDKYFLSFLYIENYFTLKNTPLPQQNTSYLTHDICQNQELKINFPVYLIISKNSNYKLVWSYDYSYCMMIYFNQIMRISLYKRFDWSQFHTGTNSIRKLNCF